MLQRSMLVFAVLIGAPATSMAQGLAHLVPDLILNKIVSEGANPGAPHAGHFTLGNPTSGGSQAASQADRASIAAVEAFGDRFKSQFANVPLGSSTGGFTWTYDPIARTYVRSSSSFGPAFAERASTIGRHRLSAGVNYQHTGFDTFGRKNLGDGSITFFLPHTDCCNAALPPPSFEVPGLEGDIVQAALRLRATSDTVAAFANFGLSDRWDVGLAIPVTRARLEASVDATIIRLSTATSNPPVHTFVANQDVVQKTFTESGDASGIGDIVARTKYAFFKRGSANVAAAADLRLPTGDEENLLGIGATQAKLYVIASTGQDRFAEHVNVGYTVSGKGTLDPLIAFSSLGASNEFNYAGGVEMIANPRLTVLGDIVGRSLIDAGNLVDSTRTFQYRIGAGATAADPLLTSSTNPLTGQPYQQLALTPGTLNLLLGSVGAKYNVTGSLLLSGNLLFPLNRNGLRDRLTYTVGIDYAF
ncbi:MAG: hypothetical protein JSU08_20020 [Acidobacteria bacterium]|nr:hypothetical protein [Acidobacteriota bacterium]